MDELRLRVVRQTLAITASCVAGSLAITAAVTYLATGSLHLGLGMFIAVLAPAILVPIGSYGHILLAARLAEANEKLRTLSETDPLTRTCNRRRFLEVAEAQLGLARRHGYPTSMLLIDFDRFKQINDLYGHLAGDRVLTDASELIRQTLRDSDTLARFGGEEFIVLLPRADEDAAATFAERVRRAVAGAGPDTGRGRMGLSDSLRLTLSAGVASSVAAVDGQALLAAADQALYAAKRSGRNRTVVGPAGSIQGARAVAV